MKINKQQKICDVNYSYKAISFITEEFLLNKVLLTFEKHKNLLNKTKNWKKAVLSKTRKFKNYLWW
ncbi:MAG: hypothetical protein OHM56_08785 [Spiroplasma phoeniceum]|nr:MAG: hypothetical protein OHM57_08180 [Spiroplasma phoeniceum]UZQ31699.1 MAG: hypothetical protein OHM56_08785 [Spiroplasma phoeniceum]